MINLGAFLKEVEEAIDETSWWVGCVLGFLVGMILAATRSLLHRLGL
jgi:hypothetical protein